MAADGQLLQGEVTEDPSAEEKDVEKLLLGFLRALLKEASGASVKEASGASAQEASG